MKTIRIIILLLMSCSISFAQDVKVQGPRKVRTQQTNGNRSKVGNKSKTAVNSKKITSEERFMISKVFHDFFVSINMRDEIGLTSTVADNLKLLDKMDATKSDVVAFMYKLYKDNVRKMLWRLDKNYVIEKREIGGGYYEYSVTFTAVQELELTDDRTSNKYRINAKIDPEGLISEFTMTKIYA